MNCNEPTYYRAERRALGWIPVRKLRLIAVLALAAGVIAAVIGHGRSSSSTAFSSTAERRGAPSELGDERAGVLGEADGAVPEDTTVFNDNVPGVAKLDGDLLSALRRAAASASDSGVYLVVDSGWRSPEYQRHLLDEAISKYGSEAEARRWVASPTRSAHVSGDAIDIGPKAAAAWLAENGDAYGLCQIYDNEPWHFELRPAATGSGCPARYADAAHDPRMQG